MGNETAPAFVVGSGRCGTRSMYKMLTGADGVEVHHEFCLRDVQRTSALYTMGLIGESEATDRLAQVYQAAVYHSDAALFIDSSHVASWVVGPLLTLFPRAHFLLLTRDGRKVASSFYHKRPDEMYEPRGIAALQAWLAAPETVWIAPPPDTRYWWKIPRPDEPFGEEFGRFNRFQQCCYHWHETNRAVLEAFQRVPATQQMTVQLEALVSDQSLLEKVLGLLGAEYDPEYFSFLQTPENVLFPMDFKLTPEQHAQFEAIGAGMMQRLGYGATDEYRVAY